MLNQVNKHPCLPQRDHSVNIGLRLNIVNKEKREEKEEGKGGEM